VEIKGFRKGDAQLKAETMQHRWVPGVNALGKHGRWAFAEFRSVYDLKDDFAKLVDGFVQTEAAAE
jgi:type III restriction enzyme